MHLIKIENVRGRDFTGTLECEHCKAQAKLTSGYHDDHYHDKVIPAFHCDDCGRNRAGEFRSEEVTAKNVANGVNGV